MEHDLLNDDDFFERLKKQKDKDATGESQPPEMEQPSEEALDAAPQEEPVETDLFEQKDAPEFSLEGEEPPPAVEPEPEQSFEEKPIEDAPPDFSADMFERPEQESEPEPMAQEMAAPEEEQDQGFQEEEYEQEEEFPEEEQPQKPKILIPEDYEDETQPAINYRPVIIGGIVVVAAVILFFVLRTYVFTGEKEEEPVAQETTEQVQAEQQQQPEVDPLEAQRASYLNNLAGENNFHFGLIGKITTLAQTHKVQISSLLFYSNELSFEVFAKDRTQLAGITMALRKAFPAQGIKLVAANQRPGDGITGVFAVDIKNVVSEPAEVSQKFSDVNGAQQWLEMVGQQFSVKINDFYKTTSSADQFGLTRQRFVLKAQGSYEDCLRFLSAVGNSNRNIKVHKLIFAAKDQRTFSKKRYSVELIADLYY